VNGPGYYNCSCSIGYTGTTCLTKVQCAAGTYEKATYLLTQAGYFADGTCVSGYSAINDTNPTLFCNQSGSQPVWEEPEGGCTPLYCSAYNDASVSFPITQALYNATSTCKANYSTVNSHNPTGLCLADGTWGPIQNPCLLITPTTTPTATSTSTSTPTIPTPTPTSTSTLAATPTPTTAVVSNISAATDQSTIIGIAVGVGGACLILLLLALGIWRMRRNRRVTKDCEDTINLDRRSESTGSGYTLKPGMQQAMDSTSFAHLPAADATLTNTMQELSFPGFLCIDFTQQLRKEEAVGSGGFASIYRGTIIDEQLRKVT